MKKIAVLTSHAIQYQDPLFKRVSSEEGIDLMVYFCWDFGVKESFDPEFGLKLKWDQPILQGYRYEFLKNYSPRPSSEFWGQINPGIIKRLCQGNYDAVWIHGYFTFSNWLGFIGAWITRTPILLRGESQLLRPRSLLKLLLKKILLTFFFKFIAAFLAIGKLNKEYLLHYGVNENKIFLVPYVADNKFFSSKHEELAKKRDFYRNELGFDRDDVIVMYSGKIFGSKGPGALDLLKAFGKINNQKGKLIYVGDGPQKNILLDYIKENSISNVYFMGFKNQTELPLYYEIADILVLPSYQEQWGMVVNEAMYFGNAIVVSDKVGAGYDLVENNKNGYIYPAGDVAALSLCLRKLFEDREVLKKMQQESLRIIEDWDLDKCVDGLKKSLQFVSN